MILIDSNVLIDVIEKDARWYDWSMRQIEEAVVEDRVFINQVVIAEAAPRSGPLAWFEERMASMTIDVEPFSNASAYRAGEAFERYRRKRPGQTPKSILADFLIGGQAETLGATILTRDPRFYRTYFPSVSLIAPAADET